MAFFSKVGNILRQTASKHVKNSEIYGSNSSIFQMIRCMSSSKVFVGGLSYNTDETGLREAFNKYGEVVEARVIIDRDSGRSRGFGFVTYTSGEEASAAIQALDGQDLHGRRVRVNYATDRAPRVGGFGGGGYGGDGGGYGNNYGGGGNYGNYGSGGGYGGNNYGSGGGGGGYGSNNYGSGGSGDSYGGGNYAQGGTYGSATNYDSGNSGNQSFGVAGGGGGSENYVSADAGGNAGFTSSVSDGTAGWGHSGDQFGSNESTNKADASEDFGVVDDPVDGSYKDDDDDEPDDYANKRA